MTLFCDDDVTRKKSQRRNNMMVFERQFLCKKKKIPRQTQYKILLICNTHATTGIKHSQYTSLEERGREECCTQMRKR